MSKNSIVEWYNGKSIFITGGSGFMGKVLIEKLLFSCTGVKEIYVLMRSKKGKSPVTRIQDMWKLPMFARLRESQPEAIKKVVPVVGDLNSEGLGLSPHDLSLLVTNANVVFHCGATLKLEASLKDAVEQNTAGTARVIDVSKQMKHLCVFVYFSTAFCSADIDVFEEKVYDCRDNPRDVIEVSRWMKNDALDPVTKSIIAPHPNTYTYSKRLAEKLVADELENMRVCIVRPSVVTPAVKEPLPGWVDSLNGPMGLLVGAGKGVIRSMHVKAENRAQTVPVDIAINATIVIAQRIGSSTEKLKEVPVYNLTQDEVVPYTMGEILDIGRRIVYENPFEMQIWYPDGDIRSSRFIHNIYCIFLHWLPAYLIDFLLFLFRYKTFMVRLQRKIHDGLELLQFFTVRQWIFRSGNFLALSKNMTDEENKTFPMDFKAVPVEEYLTTAVLGARQYLMKEDLSTIPRCRTKQKFLYVIHKIFVYGIYLLLIWMLVSILPHLKVMFDAAGRYAHKLPIVGTFISK
ncbi:putative fatty acyl-CoA reductase CG5065 [Tribolium madens]|uniref:putative fatty acyl-CoA reductase CG5065 n=1 Tax=Tribolium madens TaxID=41895 RepID=UPI001CF732FA|nr:putative fatty acyl-CoA reductase CG5065 [Tribolium madens]